MVHMEIKHEEELEFEELESECNRSEETFRESSNWGNHIKKELWIDRKEPNKISVFTKRRKWGSCKIWGKKSKGKMNLRIYI